MFRSIRAKILALNIVALLSVTAIILAIIAYQKGRLGQLLGKELDSQTRSLLESVAKDVYYMCRAQDEALQLKLQSDMNVAKSALAASGGFSANPASMVEWEAANQAGGDKLNASLPQAFVGGKPLERNFNVSVPSPLVDDIKRLTGSTCTIFQRMDEEGDMLRICTNVETLDGKRAIGTFIGAKVKGQDGALTENPIVKQVLRGEMFTGRAFVVNKWYLTSYAPIIDPSGRVSGMLYVGVPQESVASLRKGISSVKVGKSGYVFVLGGHGRDLGRYIISKNGDSDGKDIYGAKDSDGRLFIKEMIDSALKLKEGEVCFEGYSWQNKDEKAPRRKIAALASYAPWDWVIGVSAYEDDFLESRLAVDGALNYLMASALFWGLAVIAVFIALAAIVANRIVSPIVSVSAMLKDIAQGEGDLTRRLSSTTKDEVAEMVKWFNTFIDKLQRIMQDISGSSQRLSGSAQGLFRISGDMASGANHIKSQVSEVAGSAEGLNSIAANLSSSAGAMGGVHSACGAGENGGKRVQALS